MSHSQHGDSPRLDTTANNNKAALPGKISTHFVHKEIIMNAKLLYAATIAVALLASGAAMASEATQFNVPASTQTRATVKTELSQAMAKANGQLPRSFETDQRALQPTATVGSMRARAEVRAEARSAARRHEFNPNYIGA